jgi:hypothetical protein
MELTDKLIDLAEAEILFTAGITDRGVECFFYGVSTWTGFAPDAQELAKKWACCITSDPIEKPMTSRSSLFVSGCAFFHTAGDGSCTWRC